MQCDQCERWVHQICGLFNKGRNTQTTHYMCPMCLKSGGSASWGARILASSHLCVSGTPSGQQHKLLCSCCGGC